MSPKKTADVKADATAPAKKAAAKKTAIKKATTKKTAAAKTASANKASKTTEKKLTAAQVQAAKEAEVLAGSNQTPAEIKEALSTLNAEAIDGEKYIEAVDQVKPYEPKKEEPAAPKAAPEKAVKETPAQAAAAAKAKEAEVLAGSNQTPAEIKEALSTLNAEAIDGEKYIEAVDQVKPYEPVEVKPAAKAPAKKAAKKTAKASKETAKEAAAAKKDELVAQSNQTPEQIKEAFNTLKAEDAAGQKYIEAVDQVKPYEPAEVKPAKKAAKKPDKKAVKETPAQAAAAAKAKEADIIEQSNQTPAEIKEAFTTLQAEEIAGQKYIEAVDANQDAPYTPEQLSRQVLAAKAFAEGCAQKNLAARSKAGGAKAAKLYKKPSKKAKAVSASAAGKKIASDIMKEAKAETRLQQLIKEVPGTPYETVVKEVEKKAAMESRKALAAKAKTAPLAGKPQTSEEEKNTFYSTLDDYTLLEMAQALGLNLDLEGLKQELTHALDIDEQIAKYLDEAKKANKKFTFEVDGFDTTVIPFLCRRIAATLPNKAADNVALAKKISTDVDRILINEGMNDSAIYKDLLDDVRQVLVYAQHHNLHTLEEVSEAIPADLDKLVDRFMTVAYTILPGWQYNDVKYYEGFIYGVMAQFDDLVHLQNRTLMDIADLYIKHGDYQNGNSGYGYVLRENQLKDQIYYRFAHVYEPFDLQRAKNIAQDALRVIDGRYDYYPKILEILQK
ncbi:hypothetical protein IM774_11310 [Erysipelotrichaceae bacterium RD49]|nr:hypothetical protein [Erysipelotrichaceae bacterium RD49]